MILSSMREVFFGYGQEAAIENLSLDIHTGQLVGITGENGAAKSTLLKLMLGLLKPWSGTINFNRVQDDGTRLNVAYVPQQIASFNAGFPSKVSELVSSGCYSKLGLFRRFKSEHRQKVEQVLQRTELWAYRERRIGELSGGQKQRVCIARALVQEPDVLILDEPTAGMDAVSRIKLYGMLREDVSRYGRTVIMVTHGVEEAAPYLDTLIHLERKEGGWKCSVTNSCSEPSGLEV